MSQQHLSDHSTLVPAISPSAGVAATSNITGATLDTDGGWTGVAVEIMFGTIASGASTSFKLEHGDLETLSDAEDVDGTETTVLDSDDGKVFVVDIRRPTKRYLRLFVDRGDANAAVAAFYRLYGNRQRPAEQDSAVESVVRIVYATTAPAEG